MPLVEVLGYCTRGGGWASVVNKNGRDGIGKQKGLCHSELLDFSIALSEIEKAGS